MIRTVYVLFAIEIWSRRVQILGVTRNPNSAWVTQQAGTLRWGKDLEGSGSRLGTEMRSTPVPFDEVFQSEGVGIVITPIRAPRANAFAKRWVRTVRAEWLDWVLIFSRRHLERVVRIYAAHYNDARPPSA